MIEHEFRACTLRVFPETRYVETVFRDGTKAPATRECELNNLSYAKHLGYPDCWTAVVTHEAAHTLVSERMGRLHSPTLWAVAHGYEPGTAPYEARLYEEALILAIERYANTGEVGAVLYHPDLFPQFAPWACDLRRLAAKLLSLPEAA